MKTGFIGAGNMGSALICGLAQQSTGIEKTLRVFDSQREKAEELEKSLGLCPAASCLELVSWAEIILIAVKPGDVKSVLSGVKAALNPSKMIVSIAAGVDTRTIEVTAGLDIPVVRAMPNTPALIGLGMTAICPGGFADERHMDFAESLLAPSGKIIRVEEDMMDAITAISGSGPAYLFYLAEAMEQSAEEQGLSGTAAREIVTQTLYGASAMLAGGLGSPEELRRRVTSPGGTTEAAVETLDSLGFSETIKKAVSLARERSGKIRKSIATLE